MPVAQISRSQLIHRPVSEVYSLVRPFENWPKWSPWLLAAPGFELQFVENAYSWEGEAVGKGRMRVVDEVENELIQYELTFLKPHRSKAEVSMHFAETADGTMVTWSMETKLPFFLFWLKGLLQNLIGADYERGLLMLKDLAETGAVRSRVEVPGRGDCGFFVGVGIKRTASMDDFTGQLKEDNEVVREHYPKGQPMTVYHKWCLKKRKVTYVTGVRLERMPGVVADGMKLFEFPGGEVFTVKHTGDFRHLGNGWAGAMMNIRGKKLKPDKKVMPFEVYEDLESEDPVVRISFPLKA
jgi:hypothetical protein